VVDDGSPHAPADRTLLTSRIVAAGMLVAVLAIAAAALAMPPGVGRYRGLVVPAALAGLVSPVIGYRLYALSGAKVTREDDVVSKCGRFQHATVTALAVPFSAALLGIVVTLLSGDPAAMTGVVTHVLLTGAIWPSRVRLKSFVDPGGPWSHP
jgi:hypothetical protein